MAGPFVRRHAERVKKIRPAGAPAQGERASAGGRLGGFFKVFGKITVDKFGGPLNMGRKAPRGARGLWLGFRVAGAYDGDDPRSGQHEPLSTPI